MELIKYIKGGKKSVQKYTPKIYDEILIRFDVISRKVNAPEYNNARARNR